MKKLLMCFTCIYGTVLIGVALREPSATNTIRRSRAAIPSRSLIPSRSVSVATHPKKEDQSVATHPKKEDQSVATRQSKKESPTTGSFTLSNKTGVYTTATPRTISINGVTLNPIFAKQQGTETTNQIINVLKYQEVSSDDSNPTSVSRGIVGLQLKIGNKIYLAAFHSIPQNAVLEVVDRGIGFAIQSPKDAMVKIKSIGLRFNKGQTKMLKTGIDIPDLPPEIFSLRRMKIPGLNPLSN